MLFIACRKGCRGKWKGMGSRVLLLFLCVMSSRLRAGEVGSPLSPASSQEVSPRIRRLLPEIFWKGGEDGGLVLAGRSSGGSTLFYSAAVEALDKGGAGNREFLAMSRHPSLAVRVVGMAGLAREGTEFGLKRLRELLASRESAPGLREDGREVTVYESAVAWHFLTGTGYLCCRRVTPLLEEKEALAFALEVLSRDEWAGAREPSYKGEAVTAPAAFIMERIKSGKLALTIESLRMAAPDLPMEQLVKAAGRLPAEVSAPFLRGLLHDGKDQVTSYAGLAAASALDRQLVETGGKADPAEFLKWRDTLVKCCPESRDEGLFVFDPAEWRKHSVRWPEALREPSDGENSVFPAWAALALCEPEAGDTRPLVSSTEALTASLEKRDLLEADWNFKKWNAFRDTLFRLELRVCRTGRKGEREFQPESARLALLRAVRRCEPGSISRPDPTDNIELIWKIHDLIKAIPSPATAAEMKAYTGTVPRANDTPFRMVPIPGGEFFMGSPDSEKGRRPDEGPRVKVEIEPFWMGACEVTWDAYLPFMLTPHARYGDGALRNPGTGLPEVDAVSSPTAPYTDMTFGMGDKGYPAIAMTQHAALKFCQWLSAQTGHFYRLPTEAEWEYAARAHSTTAYYWGDDPALLPEHGWFFENSAVSNLQTTHPVGLKKPNPWGLHDIYGNVAEWTLDQYSPDWYATLVTSKTPGPSFLKPVALYPRSVRGGSYEDDASQCRSASRRGSTPDWLKTDANLPRSFWYLSDCQFVGFRIVRPLKVPSPEEMHRIWNSGLGKEAK